MEKDIMELGNVLLRYGKRGPYIGKEFIYSNGREEDYDISWVFGV